MASEVRNEFLLNTYRLSKTDPAAWENFLIAYQHYMEYELERALSAPTADVLISVGMGRKMRDLRDDFFHIENLMEKIKK